MLHAPFPEAGRIDPESQRQAETPARVLIIDDDELFGEMLADLVQDLGFAVQSADSLGEGLVKARQGDFDAVFLDLRLPDGSGLELLPRLRELPAPPEVVLITGAGDPDGAELAMVNGAWDAIEKQSSIKKMTLALSRALQYRAAKRGRSPGMALNLEGIVGNSPAMRACYDRLALAATGEASVLISGETGTGKELFARAIHLNSARKDQPFVVVDCAALPEALVESALFGCDGEACTGAGQTRAGLMQQADGGTLFLAEAGGLPLTMQKAVLKVLQERRFRPLGARGELKSNFRLVAATTQDLEQMVGEGSFSLELLSQLRSLTLDLPPLRKRKEDIRELVLFHTARLGEASGSGTKGVAPEFLHCLMAHDWPGNVEELVNTLEQALVAAGPEPTLLPRHLPGDLGLKTARPAMSREDPHGSAEVPRVLPKLKAFREAVVARAEQQYLQDLMHLVDNSIKEACKLSALSVPRLYALLKKHKIAY